MRTFERGGVIARGALLVVAGVALAIAPVRLAAQEGTTEAGPPTDTMSAQDSARGYDEPISVWNAHRVVRVIGDGTHVVLGDGTIWEIFLPDRPSVDTWRRGDLLVVRERSLAQGDYDYSRIDGRTRGEVAARLVGAAPRRG